MTLTPLGDQAILAAMPDEAAAVRLAAAVRAANPAWLEDVVPAYASVGVFFDADRVDPGTVSSWLQSLPKGGSTASGLAGKSVVIPVCYEKGPDLARVTELTGRSTDEVIALHSGQEYTVYAIGFVPGFPYLGYLPKELAGVPRLESPQVRVEPGSVGLTGRQTGIYPLPRPGGWNLIGRTPLTIVDVEDGYFPLRVGDKVRFERIDSVRYDQLNGKRI
jgi:inhibitor of KinA